jgi:hypothetical protein
MVSLADNNEFQYLRAQAANMSWRDIAALDEWVPPGTEQRIGEGGIIIWLDPVIKRCINFHDMPARNAFIMLNRDKGVFKSNKLEKQLAQLTM